MSIPKLLLVLCVIYSSILSAQSWERIERIPDRELTRDFYPKEYLIFKVNNDSLKDLLWNAPFEVELKDKNPIKLEVPLADGSLNSFSVYRYRMMEKALESKFPDFRTFKGFAQNGDRIRIDYTLHGFRAVIQSPTVVTYIDYLFREELSFRIIYDANSYPKTSEWSCGYQSEVNKSRNIPKSAVGSSLPGCTFREYRLALACTDEYALFHGSLFL